MFCPECLQPTADDSVFCQVCGSQVHRPTVQVEAKESVKPTAEEPDWDKYEAAGKSFTEYQKDHSTWLRGEVAAEAEARAIKAVEQRILTERQMSQAAAREGSSPVGWRITRMLPVAINVVGGAAIVMSLFFPPWLYTFQNRVGQVCVSAGYASIFKPPEARRQNVLDGVALDYGRLAVQVAGIIAIGLTVLVCSRGTRKR